MKECRAGLESYSIPVAVVDGKNKRAGFQILTRATIKRYTFT